MIDLIPYLILWLIISYGLYRWFEDFPLNKIYNNLVTSLIELIIIVSGPIFLSTLFIIVVLRAIISTIRKPLIKG